MLTTVLPHLLSRTANLVGGDDSLTTHDANLTSSGGSSQSSTDTFLDLIASPFQSQISSASFLSALAVYGSSTIAVFFVFFIVRPRQTEVYEPLTARSRERGAPPPLPTDSFGWLRTVIRASEVEVVSSAGTDAAVFLRFTRMLRNIFTLLAVISCALLVPVNVVTSPNASVRGVSFFSRLTPQYLSGVSASWAYVAVAYVFDAIICAYLYHNYRAVRRLREEHRNSREHQSELYARTVLVTDVPRSRRSDNDIGRLLRTHGVGAIGRDVEDLPELVKEHDMKVERLRLKRSENPDRDYAADVEDVQSKAATIRRCRRAVSKPDLLSSYGFVTFRTAAAAHDEVHHYRRGGPNGTTVRPAAAPTDLIWRNLDMSEKDRAHRKILYQVPFILLTVAWLVPNVFIAVFLSNLSHLGSVWPSFRRNLHAHPTAWAVFQGIAAPALTCLFYFFLPKIFRRLAKGAGEITKSSRERHVTRKLFAFFLFNHLVVFSLFSALWTFGAAGIDASRRGNWRAVLHADPVGKIALSLITVSPYWCSWLLQRNLGAAIDLGQLLPLLRALQSRRRTPTSAHRAVVQSFDYASYYNYFLFYAAVALCFGALQPLALVVACLYFWLDSFVKKYMLLYIFVTKHESAGMFWSMLSNRMLVNALLGNVVIAVVVATQGSAAQNSAMLAAMLPLPLLLGLFQWYCRSEFDARFGCVGDSRAMAGNGTEVPSEAPCGRGRRAIEPGFRHPALTQALKDPRDGVLGKRAME